MDSNEALRVANAAVFTALDRYLNDLESDLLQACWRGESYADFADSHTYSIDHIRATAAKLWKEVLSVALGEPVSLRSFKQALERYKQRQSAVQERKTQIDWGEAPDVSLFYGRVQELEVLKTWIVAERCRTIALLGLGGIGKTTLSVKLAQELQSEFEVVIWRSLREGPSLEDVLDHVINLLSNQQELEFPPAIDGKITLLIHYFRQVRCLLILDNVETILQPGSPEGHYREGYEGYGSLLQRVGEVGHQSCLLITSREKPKEIALLAGERRPVRCWRVEGLQAAALEILTDRGVKGSEEEKQHLVMLYDGNPLALMLVCTSIQELFSGQISSFLCQETVTFNGISRLLDEQFNRLSPLEQAVLYWLAINREPVPIEILLEDIVPQPLRSRLLESLENLRGRSLIEASFGGYTLQNMVMEYMTDRLVERMGEAIAAEEPEFLNRYALIKATAKDYVKETQTRLILKPVLAGVKNIQYHLTRILAILRAQRSSDHFYRSGYAGGNVFNLYCHLRTELSDADFSHLTLWQADLQKNNLQGVNFSYSAFAKSSFRYPFGFVQGVAFSPDGTLLATGTSKGEIRIWRVADFQEIFVLRGHTNWVWQIAFSASGKVLASGSADGTLKLWQIDADAGHCRQTLRGHTDEVYSVALSPDAEVVVSGSRDHTIKFWCTRTGECLHTLQDHTNAVCSVVFSPDGQLLASSGYDKTIRLWQVSTRQCLKILEGHRGELSTLAFSPDGQILASGGYEFAIKLWQVRTGECLRTLEGHTSRISCVQFSPDGQLLVSSSHSQNMKLWQISTGECLKNFQGHTNLIRTVTFSPDGKILASGGDDQMVKIWQVETGECLKTWRGYGNCVWKVAFSPDGKWLASANHDQSIRLWAVETGECYQTLWGHEDCVWAVAFSPDGKWLASASNELGADTLRLWHLDTGECVKLVGHLGSVHSVAFSPDGQWLASCGTDWMIKLWHVDTQQCLNTLHGHTAIVRSVAFSPDGRLLATGADDRTVKLWQVKTGECLKTLAKDDDWIWSVAFSPDGKLLASSGEEGMIKLWQVATGQCVRVLQGHWNAIYSVEFSPNGDWLASAGADYSVRLWRLKTGDCIHTLQGHAEEIWSIAFSPDGQRLASSSEDGDIKLWQVTTGVCLQTLRAPKPYEGMNIAGITGVTETQKSALKTLGAVESEHLSTERKAQLNGKVKHNLVSIV